MAERKTTAAKQDLDARKGALMMSETDIPGVPKGVVLHVEEVETDGVFVSYHEDTLTIGDDQKVATAPVKRIVRLTNDEFRSLTKAPRAKTSTPEGS